MKTYDRIKNFSTSIPAEKTIAEIEVMLAKHKAKKIMKEFDDKGLVTRLSFTIDTENGEMPVKLPMNKAGLMDVFKFQVHQKKLPRKFWGSEWSEEQAMRVGWRIIKDWLDAQLSLLDIEMVKISEIFLPYIYNAKLGKTMFELLEKSGFNMEQLEFKGEDDVIDVEAQS